MTTDTTVEDAIRLVLGVARLGESDLAGWWGSHGLDRAGSYVLSRSFRRTWHSAALELDIEAASRRHEDVTARRRTALHLFSDELPFRRWTRAWLADQKTTAELSPIFDMLAAWDLSAGRAAIEGWTGQAPRVEVVGDGMRLGALSRSEVDDPATAASAGRLLAATYLTIDGPFRVPYFDLQG